MLDLSFFSLTLLTLPAGGAESWCYWVFGVLWHRVGSLQTASTKYFMALCWRAWRQIQSNIYWSNFYGIILAFGSQLPPDNWQTNYIGKNYTCFGILMPSDKCFRFTEFKRVQLELQVVNERYKRATVRAWVVLSSCQGWKSLRKYSNLRQINFTIWYKYILQFEKNTFYNLRQIQQQSEPGCLIFVSRRNSPRKCQHYCRDPH